MALPSDVLTIAASQIGVREEPDGSNITPYTEWFGLRGAWCAMWVSWVLFHAGVPVGPGSKGGAWCSAVFDFYANQGRGWIGVDGIRAGDLIFFEWGTTAGGYDHIGMVERVNGDGTVTTIEGNVGNRVQRLTRSLATGGIHSHARPHYTTTTPPPAEENDVGTLTGDQGKKFDELYRQIVGDGVEIDGEQPRPIRDPIGETRRIVAGLDDLDASEIAAAIPDAIAKDVADELAKRLKA